MASSSSISMSKSIIIALQSSKLETFKFEFKSEFESELELQLQKQLESLKNKHKIEDNCRYTNIITNFNSKALAKVSEYWKRHVVDPKSSEDLRSFDADFVREDLRTLEDVNSAARYLGIKSLEDLTTRAGAYTTRGETPEQRRAEMAVAIFLDLQHRMVGVE